MTKIELNSKDMAQTLKMWSGVIMVYDTVTLDVSQENK